MECFRRILAGHVAVLLGYSIPEIVSQFLIFLAREYDSKMKRQGVNNNGID
jgi:hypothetical protein